MFGGSNVMKQLIYLLIVVVFTACNPDKKKEVSRDQSTFRIDQSSLLFFRNTRTPAYTVSTIPNTQLDSYRLRDWNNEMVPSLPEIVINWKYDEAYIYFNPPFVSEFSIVTPYDSLIIDRPNKMDMLKGATLIYEAVQKGGKVELNGRPYLDNARQREAFRLTLQDYFRLTRRY